MSASGKTEGPTCLLDHLVGNGDKPWGDFEAKRLGGLEI